jgi:hypothetical protein
MSTNTLRPFFSSPFLARATAVQAACTGLLFFRAPTRMQERREHTTKADQLEQTPSPYPYLARPTVSLSSPYPSPFPADSVFALRMQSMTAGAREQEVAHAVLCGEERETVEKGSAGTRRLFCGDGCGGCWRAK